MIYCIGDSHVTVFTGRDKINPRQWKDNYPFFKTYWVGAATAYNLGKKNSTSRGREKLFAYLKDIPPASTILMVFGEIDCRWHLLKQAEKTNRSLIMVVKECVERYLRVAQEIKTMGYKVWVWGIMPSTIKKSSKKFPLYGSMQERNLITSLFNFFLRQKSYQYGIGFISIFEELLEKNQQIKKEYFFDGVHLSQKVMPLIIKKFKAENLI